MQLIELNVDSFLQIRTMDLDLSKGIVHLIVGHNECGKSSVHEAIRFAMLGETDRVTLKRDYPLMIRSGAKSASVRIAYVDQEGNHDFISRDVATGKVTQGDDTDPEFGIDAIMDATKYPLMDDKHARTFLTQLLQIKIDRADVKAALIRKGLPLPYAELIQPMLRAGFTAAHTEAKSQQSAARAQWEQLTGEKWGSTKGGNWKPSKKTVVQPMVDAQRREAEKRQLAFQASLEKVGELRAYQGGFGGECPSCKTLLVWSGKTLKLKSEEPSQADLGAAEKAKIESDSLQKLWQQEANTLADMEGALDFNTRMGEIEKEALGLNGDILNWMQAVELLAPDGIPGQMIADKLKPINDRLRETAMATGWEQVTILPTVSIQIGSLPYSLCSESSQWRAQACVAEAISKESGLGVLCLDRFDVLDISNRARLLKWIYQIADQHNTILLFGTLKEAPTKLPDTFSVHWLDNGKIVGDPF